MQSEQLRVFTVVSQVFGQNSFVAALAGSDACVVIDPGMEPHKIFAVIEQEGLTPAAILCTHGHADHIAGNGPMKERWPDCPLWIGEIDAPKLTDPVANLSSGFGVELISPEADRLLQDGEHIEPAGIPLEVRLTPGHCKGHVVFVAGGVTPTQVFGGDLLFAGSVGRTDFPDSDFGELEASIRESLYTLPDDTVVLPGHGPATTVGREKRSNPFVPGV